MGKAIYGLIGYPVKHSLSPLMHNAAFRALGFDAEYRLFEVLPEELEDFLLSPAKEVRDLNNNKVLAKDIVGFNVTIPHKVRTKEILQRNSYFSSHQDYYVEISGAVNTVKRSNGGGIYCNTDAYGFEISLKKELKFSPERDEALVIGCGGVGRVIIPILAKEEYGIKKVYVYDKSEDAIKDAKEHFTSCSIKYPYIKEKIEFILKEKIVKIIGRCGLLVNASSVGMKDDSESVIDTDFLHSNLYVYDVVYNRKTKLVREAERRCKAAVGGLSMLLYQGVSAFKIWTEKEPPIEVMREALEKGLQDVS